MIIQVEQMETEFHRLSLEGFTLKTIRRDGQRARESERKKGSEGT